MNISNKDHPNFSVLFDDLRNVTFGAWRYRWIGLGMVWALCIAGWLWVMTLPNIYEASSRMYLDTQSSLRPLLEGLAVNTDRVSEAAIMARSLTSTPSLERIATMAGMTSGISKDGDVQSVVAGLRDELQIGLDRSQVLNVNYANPDPDVALSVVTQLIDTFVEGLLNANRQDSQSAQDFLEEELRQYEMLLNEAEARLADFKKENIGRMPGAQGDYFSRLQTEQEVLGELEADMRLARQRQAELRRQMVGESPVFGLVTPTEEFDGSGTAAGRQIAELEQQLVGLRMQYTDSHPDIVRIQVLLEDLREEARAEQQITGGDRAVSGSLDTNPVYQSMRIQLSAVDLELNQLQSRIAEQADVVKGLRDKVDVIPDIEANLTRLNRDYEVIKNQYDALLRRLESARLTEAAEDSKTDIDFRIIDPPSVTTFPVGPDRPLMMTGVLVLSALAGMGLMIFMSFTRPVFYSVRGLEKHFGVPVLGGIRNISTDAEIAAGRKKLAIFVGGVVGVLGAYAVVLIFAQSGAELIGGLAVRVGLI